MGIAGINGSAALAWSSIFSAANFTALTANLNNAISGNYSQGSPLNVIGFAAGKLYIFGGVAAGGTVSNAASLSIMKSHVVTLASITDVTSTSSTPSIAGLNQFSGADIVLF